MTHYSKTKFLLAFGITFGLIALIQSFCHFPTPPMPSPAAITLNDIPDTDIADSLDSESTALPDSIPADTLVADTLPQEPAEAASADRPHRRPLRAGSRVWSYPDNFPDVQDLQLPAAIRSGISPAQSRDEINHLVQKHKLVDITHSPFYVVDDLTHSMPFLVPKAQHLINTIGINFIDSLRSKGLQPHLPIISSVLRTADDVQRLQRGNHNATTNSCHCYGTTVDIAYHRFMPLQGTYPDSGVPLTRWDDNLKFVLAEVLNDLRDQGKCYVKYERKQACFHLTVR